MNLTALSRCTGFPRSVLESFAAQGILRQSSSSTTNTPTTFDGQAFLRTVVELKNAR
jgi:hypothetical protein